MTPSLLSPRKWGYVRRPSLSALPRLGTTGGTGSPRSRSGRRRHRTGTGTSRGRSPEPSVRRSWMCCTRTGLPIWPQPRCGRSCSMRASTWGRSPTFYRLLRAAGESRERRRQATHPAAVKPELVATAPNQVWSWDITKLHGPAKWTYYYLYVILDIYSRYV